MSTLEKKKKPKKRTGDALDPQINRTGSGPHKDPSKYSRKEKHKNPETE